MLVLKEKIQKNILNMHFTRMFKGHPIAKIRLTAALQSAVSIAFLNIPNCDSRINSMQPWQYLAGNQGPSNKSNQSHYKLP